MPKFQEKRIFPSGIVYTKLVTTQNLMRLVLFLVSKIFDMRNVEDKKHIGINVLLTPQNGQTHSNNSLAISRRIVWVFLTILWGWRLKG